MNLSAVNKRAEQTVLMLTYKYVVMGRGREPPSHTLEALNRKTQERNSRVPRWDFFMNLSAVNKRAEQTVLMLTYKYVVMGRGREPSSFLEVNMLV